jgi:DNA-binding transcriptional ArsR family regulator
MAKHRWSNLQQVNADAPEKEGHSDGAVRAADFLRALANPHRLMLLKLLSERNRTVMDLCGELKLRQSLVSQHLARLRLDGLVKAERQGHFVMYSLNDERARALVVAIVRMFDDKANDATAATNAVSSRKTATALDNGHFAANA